MRVKLLAASAALAVAAGGGAAAAIADAATSTPGYLSITLLSSNDGARTAWSYGDPLLTVGSTTSTTYAEMVIDGINGHGLDGSSAPVPGANTEPKFKTDHYAAGSPRMVIELNNGHSLQGYPGLDLSGKSSPDANGMAWAVDNGNTYTDYQTAYDNSGADGQNVTVHTAFIVADGDQAPGTMDTLAGVEYNGYWVAPPVPLNGTGGTMVGYYSGKCVDDSHSGTANGIQIDLYRCNKTNAQNWWLEPDGTVRNHAGGPGMCLDDTLWGGQGTQQELYRCNGQANQAWTYSTSTHHLINQHNGLCLDDSGWTTNNGALLDIYGCVNQTNEQWTKP